MGIVLMNEWVGLQVHYGTVLIYEVLRDQGLLVALSVFRQSIDIYHRTHMQDLKDVTNNVHYENYRCQKLAGFSGSLTPKQQTEPPPSRYTHYSIYWANGSG